MTSTQIIRAAVVALALGATGLSISPASAHPFHGGGFGWHHGWGHGWGYGWGYGGYYGGGYGGGYGDYGDDEGGCFVKRFVTEDGDVTIRRVCY